MGNHETNDIESDSTVNLDLMQELEKTATGNTEHHDEFLKNLQILVIRASSSKPVHRVIWDRLENLNKKLDIQSADLDMMFSTELFRGYVGAALKVIKKPSQLSGWQYVSLKIQ